MTFQVKFRPRAVIPFPPRTHQGVVRIHLLEAEDLTAKDTVIKGLIDGKSDPYAVLRVGTQIFTSHHVDNNLNPQWREMYEVRGPGKVKPRWIYMPALAVRRWHKIYGFIDFINQLSTHRFSVICLHVFVFSCCVAVIHVRPYIHVSVYLSVCLCVCQVIVHEVPGQELEVEVFDKDPDQDDFLGR